MHLKHLQGGRSVRCMYESPAAQAFPYIFIFIFNISLLGSLYLHKKWILSEQHLMSYCFYQNLNYCQDLNKYSIEMKGINIFGQ